MTILIKYPSRGRPERFFQGMESIVNNVADTENYHISVTLDTDDETMNNEEVINRIESYQSASIGWGLSESKVHAINRDLPEYGDIIVVMSDDMKFTFWGFDQIIRNEFADGDFDRLIHLPEKDSGKDLATMYIAGRVFMEKMGYIYNPIYKSLFCDNDIMIIAKREGKYKYVDCNGVIEHLNPAYGHLPKDLMFEQQQEIGYSVDYETYNKRKALNFPK